MPTDSDESAALAKRLFAPDEQPADDPPGEPTGPAGNFVPHEGTNPRPPYSDDREIVRQLFDA